MPIDNTVLAILVVWQVLQYLFFPAMIVLVLWFVFRKQTQGPLNPWATFNQTNNDLQQLQQVLQALAKAGGTATAGQRNQFVASYLNAQNQLNQLDDLRRQQSELRLADMRSEAASMGIVID